MSKDEFISLTIGKPWRNRAIGFDSLDCWGLVCLYFSRVLNINVHHASSYDTGAEFLTCFQDEVVFWSRVTLPEENCIFVAYVGSAPVHVGLIIDGQAYHSRAECSHVRFDKIRTIEKLFTKVEYYTYASN